MKTSIGGYFELELKKGKEYHQNSIRLNTGRNALEYILKVNNYKRIYIPYYTCDVILEPIKKLNLYYEFYTIDINFVPIFNYKKLKKNDAFLYTNYFGLCDTIISNKIKEIPGLILDNAQSFFSKPYKHMPTFYSCRKFFGVPDGAYLYFDKPFIHKLPKDDSGKRLTHLIDRIEYGAESGYNKFKMNDKNFSKIPIREMSNLTKSLLSNINYNYIINQRIANFYYLHKYLKKYNELNINNCENAPLIYPYLISNGSKLKKKLIDNRIYIATYWPNVLKWVDSKTWEYYLSNNLVALPIDQRYNKNDMKTIISFIIK